MNATDRQILEEVVARNRANFTLHCYYGIPLSEMTKEELLAVFHEVINDPVQLRTLAKGLEMKGSA